MAGSRLGEPDSSLDSILRQSTSTGNVKAGTGSLRTGRQAEQTASQLASDPEPSGRLTTSPLDQRLGRGAADGAGNTALSQQAVDSAPDSGKLAQSSGKLTSARNPDSRQPNGTTSRSQDKLNSSGGRVPGGARSEDDLSDDDIQQQMDIAFGRGSGPARQGASSADSFDKQLQKQQSGTAGTSRKFPAGSLSSQQLDDEEADEPWERTSQRAEKLPSRAGTQGRSSSVQPTNAQSAILDNFSSRSGGASSSRANASLGSQAATLTGTSTATSQPSSRKGAPGSTTAQQLSAGDPVSNKQPAGFNRAADDHASSSFTGRRSDVASSSGRQQPDIAIDDDDDDEETGTSMASDRRAFTGPAGRERGAADRAGSFRSSGNLDDDDDELSGGLDGAAGSNAFADSNKKAAGMGVRAAEGLTPLEQRLAAQDTASASADQGLKSESARPGSKQMSAGLDLEGRSARQTLPARSSSLALDAGAMDDISDMPSLGYSSGNSAGSLGGTAR